MINMSRFLTKFGTMLLCGVLLTGCAANDAEISNSFFPEGTEAHDAQVAQWKFERAERKRLREEKRAVEAARKEAERQARLAKKQAEIEAAQQAQTAQQVQDTAQVGQVESVSLTTAPQPAPAGQPPVQQQYNDSMIPMEQDPAMAPMPSEGTYDDDTMSPMPIAPASESAGPVDLTAQPETPAETLQNEGSITREEFERLMREKQMQQEYLEMRDEQLTIHPFIIFGESSESSTLIMKPAAAPMATGAESEDMPPAVEVYPVWQEGRADAPSIFESGETATQESVTVFPLDGPYEAVPLLDNPAYGDSPGWGKVQIVNTNTATSGLTQPGVSYSRAVSVTGNPYISQSIFFDHASKRISAADRKTLDMLVAKLKDGKNKLIRVVGHASKRTLAKNSTVQDIVNYRVSLARAAAVTNVLLKGGLPAEWLEVTGYGDTLPATDGSGESGEAANRRVDVLVYHAK